MIIWFYLVALHRLHFAVFLFWQWPGKGRADSTNHDWPYFCTSRLVPSVWASCFNSSLFCTGYDWWCFKHVCLALRVLCGLLSAFTPISSSLILRNVLLCNRMAHNFLRFIKVSYATILVFCCHTHFSFSFASSSYCVLSSRIVSTAEAFTILIREAVRLLAWRNATW
jgi:hypothetical protein